TAIAIAEHYHLPTATRGSLLAAAAADERAAEWLDPKPGWLSHWNELSLLHLVTIGRRTGCRSTKAWPLFAIDGDEVLLLAPLEPTDWIANVNANALVGVGPPANPLQGTARLTAEQTEENRRRHLVVWHRLGRPAELKEARIVVVRVAPN